MKKFRLVMILLFAGCSSYTMLDTKRVSVDPFYSVQPGIPWSQIKKGDVRIWTVDGAALESIRFISGIREGVPIVDITKEKHETAYRADMTENELVDAIVDAFSLSGAQQVQAKDLRPAAFGSLQGFRFGLEFLTENGLEKEGIVLGVIADESLYLIIYTAAKLHYFDKYRDEFERIVNSIKVGKSV